MIDTVAKKLKSAKITKEILNKLFLADSNSPVTKLADRLFKKQILRCGTWKYEDSLFTVTRETLEEIVRNFQVWRNVPITKGHQENEKLEEHPELIAGYAKLLEIEPDGLYLTFSVDEENAEYVDTRYKDMSAGIIDGYEDHETGNFLGKVLTHIALVVEPYIKKMTPFLALGENTQVEVVKLTNFEEVDNMTVEKVKKKKKKLVVNPVVEAPKEVVTPVEPVADETVQPDSQPKEQSDTAEVEVPNEVPKEKEKDQPVDKTDANLSESGKSALQTQLAESQKNEKLLAEQVNTLKAEQTYTKYLSEGKLVPAQKDLAMKLLAANASTIHFGESSKSVASLFVEFLAKSPVYVRFDEKGANITVEDALSKHLSPRDIAGFKFLHKSKWEAEARKYLQNQGVDLDKVSDATVPTVTEEEAPKETTVEEPSKPVETTDVPEKPTEVVPETKTE